MILRWILALVFTLGLVAVSASQDGRYVFRYKAAIPSASMPGPVDSEGPGSPGDYDITARFFGVVGEAFDSQVPTKPGAVVTQWAIEKGTLPAGLGFDPDTGAISGTPAEETAQRMLSVRGYGPTGEMGTYASVRIDVIGPRQGASEQEFYAHTGKFFFHEIQKSSQVYKWTSVADLPEWATVQNGFLSGIPTEAGIWSVAFAGEDHLGHEVAFTYGKIVVEDGPVIAFIPDQLHHKNMNFYASGYVRRQMGELKWELEGTMPRALQFNGKTGVLSGTIPTFETTGTFRLKATDVDGTIGWSNEFVLGTLPADVSLRDVQPKYMTVNRLANFGFAAEEMVGEQEWQLAEGTLPDGISFDTATGRIYGTPTKTGTWPGIVVEVSTTASGSDRSNPFPIVVQPDLLTATAPETHIRIGEPFSTPAPAVTGGTEPYSFAVMDGITLPAGATLDPETGILSGILQEAGNQSVTLSIKDSTERVGYPFTVGIVGYVPLQASMESPLSGTRLSKFAAAPKTPEFSIIPSGEWSLLGGALPMGLSLDAKSGTMSGTPTAMGTFGPYMLTVEDGSGAVADTGNFMIEIADVPPIEINVSDREVSRLVPQNLQVAATKNTVGYALFSLESGTLPSGLGLAADGRLTGASSALGAFPDIVVRVTDAEGRTELSEPFTLTMVQPGPIDIDPSTFIWAQGIGFTSPEIAAGNAVKPFTFEAGTALPSNLSLDKETGALSGVFATAGTYGPYLLDMADVTGRTAEAQITFEILPPLTATLPSSFETNRLAAFGPVRPAVGNAVGKIDYELSGELPEGLEFDSGSIFGKPLQEGTFQVSLTVRDAAGQARVLPTTINVGPRLALAVAYEFPTLVAGTSTGLPRHPVIQNAEGSVAYEVSGTLPTGLSFNRQTGAFFGVPSQAGTWEGLTVSARDEDGAVAVSAPFTIMVTLSGTINVQNPTVRSTRLGRYFTSEPVTVGNAVAPLSFSAVPGPTINDPDGIVLLKDSGSLAGTPSSPGSRTYSLNVTDALARSANFGLRLDVVGALEVSMADVSVPKYSQVPSSAAAFAKNVIGSAAFDIVPADGLPEGLVFNATAGTITGSSAGEGTYGPFHVNVSDGSGDEATSNAFSVTVGERLPLSISYAIPTLYRDQSIGLRAPLVTNAVGTASFSLDGQLPPGISFNTATGAFSGIPTQSGQWNGIEVTVADAVGGIAVSQPNFKVTVPGEIDVTNETHTVRVNEAFTTGPVQVSAAQGPFVFTSSTPLGGLSLDAGTGSLSGISATVGNRSFSMTVKDADYRSRSFTIVLQTIGLLEASFPRTDTNAVAHSPFWFTPTVKNAIGKITWSLQSGSLPDGLSVNVDTGLISGTPTQVGTWDGIVLQAVDSAGGVALTAPLSLAVATNGLPIELVTYDLKAKPGFDFETQLPKVSNAIGDYYFFSTDAVGFGLSLDEDTGIMSGSFDTLGRYVIDLRVTDTTNRVTSEPQIVDVVPNLRLTAKPLIYVMINHALKPVPLTTEYNIGTVTYEMVGTLPDGLAMHPSTGVISGTPTRVGKVDGLRIRGTDAYGDTQLSNVFSIEVLDDGSIPTIVALPDYGLMTVGTALTSTQIYPPTVLYKNGGDVYTLNQPLPAGLSINPATGVISGTPAIGAHGIHDGYVMSVTNTLGRGSDSEEFSLKIRHQDTISLSAQTNYVRANVPFEINPFTIGNPHALIGEGRFSISSGGSGIAINAQTGVLQGAISTSRSVTGTLTDDIGVAATRSFNLNIIAPTIALSPQSHEAGTEVSFFPTVNVSGPGDVYSMSALYNLPEGLSINSSTGEISGTMPFGIYYIRVTLTYGSQSVDTGFVEVKGINSAPFAPVIESVTGAEPLAEVLSKTVPITGISATQTLSLAGFEGSGSIAYRVCRDAGCQYERSGWTTLNRSVLNGDFVQIRVTSMEGSLERRGVRLSVAGAGGGTGDWTVTTKYRAATKFLKIAAGGNHSCGIDDDSQAWCWGASGYGQLGNGTIGTSNVPVRVSGNHDFKEIAAGEYHTCGIDTSGQAWCWGRGQDGRLGHGGTGDISVPAKVQGGHAFKRIFTGQTLSCGIETSGKAWCWGLNFYGMLGDGGTANSSVPVEVSGNYDFKELALGRYHTCGVEASGQALCWGNGNLGNSTIGSSLVPVVVSGGHDFKEIAAGEYHSCGIDVSGQAWCWGQGTNGKLGNGGTANKSVPELVSGGRLYKDISTGTQHSCGIDVTGQAWCWGQANYLGNGTNLGSFVPVAVSGGHIFEEISITFAHSCGRDDVGFALCWGPGTYGKLGTGNTGHASEPVRVKAWD